MKTSMQKCVAVGAVFSILGGCATTAGEQNRADVFKAGQTNRAQEAKVIQIVAVSPAKIEVDNSEAKKNAQLAGALIGALAGASATRNTNRVSANQGAAAGAAAGVAAGAMVSDKMLVDGVTIAYRLDNKVLTSAQVGRVCEFKAGEQALLISTGPSETRVQPNSECPKETR